MSKSLRHELNAQGQFKFLSMLSLQISVGSSMLPGVLTGEWVAGGKIDHTSHSRGVLSRLSTLFSMRLRGRGNWTVIHAVSQSDHHGFLYYLC